jgi:hypothetical protein
MLYSLVRRLAVLKHPIPTGNNLFKFLALIIQDLMACTQTVSATTT